MAIVMQYLSNELVQPTDYDLISEIRYGSNGDPWGTPEIDAGTADDFVTGRMTWDNNLSDGLDSRLVPVSLIVLTGDVTIMQWTVGDQTLTYLGPTCTNIAQLQITSGVSGQASFQWSDLQISFYSQGTQVDYASIPQGTGVDQTSTGLPQERIVTVVPENSYVDEIHLTGYIRMTASPGTYLDANSAFGQVLIKASN